MSPTVNCIMSFGSTSFDIVSSTTNTTRGATECCSRLRKDKDACSNPEIRSILAATWGGLPRGKMKCRRIIGS